MLRDQDILVISPQQWGAMHVSKHHYAIELARRGNRVDFLAPPRSDVADRVQVQAHRDVDTLRLVTLPDRIPPLLRFRARPLYDALNLANVRLVLEATRRSYDVVWSFEPNLYSDLRAFGGDVHIYHPVDQVEARYQLDVAKSADVVFSVADNILDRFAHIDVPRFFINHGVSSDFLTRPAPVDDDARDGKVRVGYVGNLFIAHLDHAAFRAIVDASPDVEFHVWGPREPSESNLAATDSAGARSLVAFLRRANNVVMHGVVAPDVVARETPKMDAFLLCYDPVRDPASGANSHKVLEYLSSGKVLIANHISTYRDQGDLIRMCDPGNNARLVDVFRDTIAHLDEANAPALQAKRIAMAHDNAYARQIERIETKLVELGLERRARSRSGRAETTKAGERTWQTH